MNARHFLRQLLAQSLTVASDPLVALSARNSMARLAAHLLRELEDELTEADISLVVSAIGRSLDNFGVIMILGRGLWLVVQDEVRLYVAYYRLAACAFVAGHHDVLRALLDLLALMHRPPLVPPPPEWCAAAVTDAVRFGGHRRLARLLERWIASIGTAPPWIQDAVVLHPRVAGSVRIETLATLLSLTPTSDLWRAYALRDGPLDDLTFGNADDMLTTLTIAVAREPEGDTATTLRRWHSLLSTALAE